MIRRNAGLRRIAWGVLAAQLCGLVHLAVVPHVTCPRDGEWTHAQDSTSYARPTPPALAWTGGDALPVLDRGHEHCAVVLIRPAVPRAIGGTRLIAEQQPDDWPLETFAVLPAESVLSRAPKQSPPLRAG